jgi:DNA-binding NtrC family response regulator
VLTLLIVDDDELALRYLPKLLEAHFSVLTAEGAFDALRWLEEVPVDVLLSDFKLQVENGLWLLAQAQARFPATRRLLMSGQELRNLAEHQRGGLFERFFSKPLEVLELVSVLCELASQSPRPASERRRILRGGSVL